MDTLVVFGTSAAYFYSVLSIILANVIEGFEVTLFFETSVLLILFILFGRLLENIAKGSNQIANWIDLNVGKTSEAITKLLALKTENAILLKIEEQGTEYKVISEQSIESDLIQKGDYLKVS